MLVPLVPCRAIWSDEGWLAILKRGFFLEWLHCRSVRGMRWPEDEGARDESPRHFGPCGVFMVLHSIFGDSVRQLAISLDCWEKQYAAA